MAKLGWKQRTTKNSVKVGCEIEGYSLYRNDAINIVKSALNTDNRVWHDSHLDSYKVMDNDNKVWTICSDCSIRNKSGREMGNRGFELVTPIMDNSDFPKLEKILNALKDAGAGTSQYCGLHVHASNELLGKDEIVRLSQHMVTRQDLLFRFCRTYTDRISKWCKPTSEKFARKAKNTNNMNELKALWYQMNCSSGYSHYDSSRYHNLNLHSYFEGKGVEFRLFNSTLDYDKVFVILDLCQGFVMDAINSIYMRQYIHTDRTVYTNPDRMLTLLETYCDRMQVETVTKRFLMTENL